MANQLPAMLKSIPLGPRLSTQEPDVQPFAITGTLAEPGLPRQIAGWQPNVVPPAVQENYFRNRVWSALSRLSVMGLVTQRAMYSVTTGGVYAAGNVLRMSYDGHNNDYVLTAGDATAFDVRDHWSEQLSQDTALRDVLDFGGISVYGLQVCWRVPGDEFAAPVTVSVVSGTTTISIAQTYGGAGIPLATIPANAAPVVLPSLTTAPGDTRGIEQYAGAQVAKGRNGAEVSQAVTYTADALVTGIASADILNGSLAATLLNRTGTTQVAEIHVCAQDTTDPTKGATWILRRGVTNDGTIAGVMTNWQSITIAAVDYMIDAFPLASTDMAPASDASGGKFTLQHSYSADGLILTGGCTDAGLAPLFTASVRLTQSGIAP